MPLLYGPAMVARMFAENGGRERIPIVFASGAARLEEEVARNVAHVVSTGAGCAPSMMALTAGCRSRRPLATM